MSLRKRVMSGLFWTATARFALQFVSWCITIFVIRLLSPQDYGLMELAGVFVSFLAMISEFGLGAAIVQRKILTQSDLKAIFGFILCFSLLFSVLLLVAAPFIANLYNEPKLKLIIWLLSLTFIFSGFSAVPQGLLLRKQEYRKIAIIDFVSGICGALTTLLFAIYGMGVWSLVAGMLATRIIFMVGCQLVQPFLHLPLFKIKGMGSIFVFSGHVVTARIVWYIYSSAAASLIIGKILGKEILGLYGVGLNLASLPMEKVGGILNQVAFPAFSSIQNDPLLAGAHFLKAIRVLAIITIPICWGISSIAYEITDVFLGDKWAGAAFPIQVIALCVPLRLIRNLMYPAMLGLGRSDINLSIEIVAAVIMTLSFLAATSWGLEGVTLVWVLVFPFVFIINLIQIIHVLGISVLDVIKNMQKPTLAGIAMYVSIEFTRNALSTDLSMIFRMIFFIIIGVVTYSMVTMLINRSGFYEIMRLIKP